MNVTLIPVWDRSRAVTDWKCERARYWGYEAYGTGISQSTTSLELYLGTTVHDFLAALAALTKAGKPVDIDQLASAAAGQMRLNLCPEDGEVGDQEFAEEQAALVEGMARGFYRWVWPRLMETYPEILFAEQEMEFPHDRDGNYAPDSPAMIFMSKPDLILGDGKGTVVYVEYKTTSSKREGWVNSWDTAVQLHSTVRAVKATAGLDVTSVVIQGLYKGYESYGKQSSPFCYAYKKSGNPPFSETQVSYDYRAGFKRSPTWELEGGVREWVAGMPDNILADQFPQTPPIFLNEDLIDRFFRQRAQREWQIREASQEILDPRSPKHPDIILDSVFPQKFDQCQPGWGSGCQFRKICHGEVQDPLVEGFTPRVPHHAKELEQRELSSRD